jgi:hypothetical protein
MNCQMAKMVEIPTKTAIHVGMSGERRTFERLIVSI